MTDKPFDQEERSFLQATGLQPDNLAPLVEDAPALPADALQRIRTQARQKAGVAQPSRPRRHTVWWKTAAAVALIGMGAALAVSSSDSAMAALERLVRLVPGFGLKATDAQSLVMADPVTVVEGSERLTITGLVSDGEATQVRFVVEGLPLEKEAAPEQLPSAKPTIRLPDGKVLTSLGAATSGGEDRLEGTIWFAPLPSGTANLTLSLPSFHGLNQPFEVAIAVVDAEVAGLPAAQTGGWAEERLGVRVGVPYRSVHDGQILLSLDATTTAGAAVEMLGSNQIAPALTDDQGQSYPLIKEASRLMNSSVEPMSATFQGPPAPDATSLRLSVPVVLVAEKAEASLKIPLAKLPTGQPLPLNQRIKLGSHTFVVSAITRIDEQTFGFDLDLGPEQDGVLLQEVSIGLPHRIFKGGGWSYTGHLNKQTGQVERLEFSADPPKGDLEVIFSRPVAQLRGGWEIELPLR